MTDLERAVELRTDVTMNCDRCIEKVKATKSVICWYGCQHFQCDDCAKATSEEARNGFEVEALADEWVQ